MSRRFWVLCMLSVALAACQPVDPGALPATPGAGGAPGAPAQLTASPTAEPAATATQPPTATQTAEPTPGDTATPEPTLTEWEQVQRTISMLRNRLDSYSDGYNGLTIAMAQVGPNDDWCGGLSAAIGDFNYVGDTESAQALEELKTSQNCP